MDNPFFRIIPFALLMLMLGTSHPDAAFEHERGVSTIDASFVSTESIQHEEALWLARGMYSESKRAIEQVLVGWVIRNRVETSYRGSFSYRDVVLDPFQFSAFNPETKTRHFYTGLDSTHTNWRWQRALRLADNILDAPATDRPFHIRTRHFYSEQSMLAQAHPVWADSASQISLAAWNVDEKRFRFFKGVL